MNLHNIYLGIYNLAKNKNQIYLERLTAQMGEEVAEKCPNIEMGFLVGSVAKGTAQKGSDIDAVFIRKYCPLGADKEGVNGSKSPSNCNLVKILDNYPVDCQLSVCNWVCRTKDGFVDSYDVSKIGIYANIIKENYRNFMLYSKPIFERKGSTSLIDLKKQLKDRYEKKK